MSEKLIVSFLIVDGIITEATERRPSLITDLTNPRDIKDAVARVANTPVSGEGES